MTADDATTKLREALAEALNGAWGDWIADTGCIPDCFTIHGPRTTRVEADFGLGNFAEQVLGWLTAAGYRLVSPATSAEDCDDPWVCCIHERPKDAAMTAPISADEARRLREAAEAVAQAWGNPEPPEDDMNAADRMWFVAMDAADTLDRLAATVERLSEENERLLLLIDSIGQDCAEALGGRQMDKVRRSHATALSDEEGE